VRKGVRVNETKFYINGVQSGTGTIPNINDSVQNLRIGRPSTWNVYYHYDGRMDELRITKKAVYTSNFTPPTAPFS